MVRVEVQDVENSRLHVVREPECIASPEGTRLTKADLARFSPALAFRLVGQRQPRASPNMLWTLQGALADIDWTRPPRKLRDFDDQVTAPLNGFSGAEHYYACSSSSAWLGKIRRPTLILAAQDDPIVPSAIFQNLVLSDQVALNMTRHGGHVGYIGRRRSDPDQNWLEWRVVEFVIGPPD